MVATATRLVAFEVPWDGLGAGDQRQVHAALSSASLGWTGAALYAVQAGALVPLGTSGTLRSVIGQTTSALAPSAAVRLDREATLDVELVSADFQLSDANPEALASGANRALVGGEVLQFCEAISLGGTAWRLRGLLRGRGGTERAAQSSHAAGTAFVLLDGTPIFLDQSQLGAATVLAAIGLAEDEPVNAPIANRGLGQRPLTPVHPHRRASQDGGMVLQWTRRARGAWTWPDEVETPLNEQGEGYVVGLGDIDQPVLRWQLDRPELEFAAATLAQLSADHSGKPLWVRQVGSFAVSEPLLLTSIP
jgi:hypothetical protein